MKYNLTAEITGIKTQEYLQGYDNVIINPDNTLNIAPGKIRDICYALETYEKMERKDTHIAACLNSRKKAILRQPFQLLIDSEEDIDKTIYDFVSWNIFEQFNNWEQMLYNCLDALGKGYSVSEKIYVKFNERLILKEIKHREPWYFSFDVEGNLLYDKGNGDFTKVPIDKFVVMTFNNKYDNPYGQSVLDESVFWWFHFKNSVTKFWISFLDKFGMPTPIAKYPVNANEKEKEALLDAINSIRNDYGIVLPEDQSLEFIETKKSGSTSYDPHKTFLEFANSEISKRILGQTLTTESSSTGSYAQSKVHYDILQSIVKADCKVIEEVINNQIIKPLVDLNFDNIKYYPYILYQSEETINQETRISVLKDLKDMGLSISEQQLREEFNIANPIRKKEQY